MLSVTTIMALLMGMMRVMAMPQEHEQNECRPKRPKVREGNVKTEEFGRYRSPCRKLVIQYFTVDGDVQLRFHEDDWDDSPRHVGRLSLECSIW